MSKHDDTKSLRHMLEHASEAVALVRDMNRSNLYTSRLHVLALTRLIEVVGEAASRVSKTRRSRYPQIPWPQIIGMRNRLIHGYDAIDLDILWQTVMEELPPLIAELEQILAREET